MIEASQRKVSYNIGRGTALIPCSMHPLILQYAAYSTLSKEGKYSVIRRIITPDCRGFSRFVKRHGLPPMTHVNALPALNIAR